MKRLTIVGAGLSPEHLSGEVKSRLGSGRLVLQTAQCYLPAYLDGKGMAWESLDTCFEQAQDFDALQGCIAETLLAWAETSDLIYVVPGSPLGLPVLPLLLEKGRGRALELLPGLSFAEIAQAGALPFGWAASALKCYAMDCEAKLHSAREAACIEELDSALLASRVKLHLGHFFADDWPLLFAYWAEGKYCYKRLPLYEIDRQEEFLYASSTCLLIPAMPFDALTQYQGEELAQIIARLRAPDGCPWDQAQTHQSIMRSLIEEAYEAVEAIELDDDSKMIEELGDLLMQVYFHAALAQDEGRFDLGEITTGISRKLIQRHPHVFGEMKLADEADVLKNWDSLKRAEKGQKSFSDALNDVPKNLPALLRAQKVQKRAENGGLLFKDGAKILGLIKKRLSLFENNCLTGKEALEIEAGSILFDVAAFFKVHGLDAEDVLTKAINHFCEIFTKMEMRFIEEGKPLELQDSGLLWRVFEEISLKKE